MKRSGVLAASASVIVLAIVGGLYLARPSPLMMRVAELEKALNRARGEIDQLKAENARLEGKSRSLSAAAEAVTRQRMLPAATPASPGETAPVVHYRLTKMDERLLEKTYGKLFEKFDLNADELAYFSRLLHDRRSKLSDVVMAALDPNLTEAQKKAIYSNFPKARTAVENESNAAIRHFLNHDEDYRMYQEWEESRPERQQVEVSAPILDAEGTPLSTEQREQLLSLLTAIRKARPPLPRGASAEDKLRQQDAEKLQILQQAASFLNPQQVEMLKKTPIAIPR